MNTQIIHRQLNIYNKITTSTVLKQNSYWNAKRFPKIYVSGDAVYTIVVCHYLKILPPSKRKMP